MDIKMLGMFAFSQAGHDKDSLYIIIREEDEYVYLADGKNKSVENPKRKNKKHIQVMKKNADDHIIEVLKSGGRVGDEEVKRAIKLVLKEYQEKQFSR